MVKLSVVACLVPCHGNVKNLRERLAHIGMIAGPFLVGLASCGGNVASSYAGSSGGGSGAAASGGTSGGFSQGGAPFGGGGTGAAGTGGASSKCEKAADVIAGEVVPVQGSCTTAFLLAGQRGLSR